MSLASRLGVIVLSAAASLCTAGVTPHMLHAQRPITTIVEAVLKSSWDRTASSTNPRAVLTLNAVRFGTAARATAQEVQVEGIPRGARVTPAIVDFTVRTYYTNEIQVLRRVREARVYRDKMGDWAIMTGSVRGEDVSSVEPPVR